MSFAKVLSRAQSGLEAILVTVEVQIAPGLPGITIVGLPETAVKESKDRVRGALIHAGFTIPRRKVVINLAPADLPKQGSRFDLPIALGILVASGQISDSKLNDHEFIGELALSGDIRKVDGTLTALLAATADNRILLAPKANHIEIAISESPYGRAIENLNQTCRYLNDQLQLEPVSYPKSADAAQTDIDLSDVVGQHHARRALEIAAAGQHNLLLLGPPGTGKSMLATRLPTILPPMNKQEALENVQIASLCGKSLDLELWQQRPFRSPHHTCSAIALVGGGSQPKPGEISLANNGVLFLDELPEFGRHALEVLREPLETANITISRAANQAVFPARFLLVAAMNPCPCGYLGDENRHCACTPDQIKRYRQKISGPLLDRIDLHIHVPRIPRMVWRQNKNENQESSATVKQRVEIARQVQLRRSNKVNQQLTTREIRRVCELDAESQDFLEQAVETMNLSTRAHYKILKIARTISDLAGSDNITMHHLAEAISFRRLDYADT